MLRFTKTFAGRYHALGTAHAYTVLQADKGWYLRIDTTQTVAGVQVSDTEVKTCHHDTAKMAKAVARAYEDLGEDYNQADYGHSTRTSTAIQRAYYPEEVGR